MLTSLVWTVILAAGPAAGCGDDAPAEAGPTTRSEHLAITASMGSPEPMPTRLRGELARNGHRLAPSTLRFAHAQHLGGPLTGGLWVIEGPRLTCILLDHPSASACDGTDEVRRRGLYVQTYEAGENDPSVRRHFIAAGVLPSTYSAVQAQIGRENIGTPLHEGFFVLTAEQPIEVQLPG